MFKTTHLSGLEAELGCSQWPDELSSAMTWCSSLNKGSYKISSVLQVQLSISYEEDLSNENRILIKDNETNRNNERE
jgi:hypothetical protein